MPGSNRAAAKASFVQTQRLTAVDVSAGLRNDLAGISGRLTEPAALFTSRFALGYLCGIGKPG